MMVRDYGLAQAASPPHGHSAMRFIKFLAAGGFAAFVNLLGRYLLTPVIGFKVSIAVAYIIGMAVAFVLFRTFVFGQSGKPVSEETYRFDLVNLIALALVWTISVALASFIFPAIGLLWHAEDIAHLIGTCVPAVSSYIGHSLYTFRRA